MKKALIIIPFILLSTLVNARTFADMFKIAYRKKLFYTSYIFLKRSIEVQNARVPKNTDRLLDNIHPSIFIHDQELDKFINQETPLDYAVAIRRFFLNDFATAKKKLRNLRKKSLMLVEGHYILGLIYLREKKFKKASSYFNSCVKNSRMKRKYGEKPESYVNIFRNRCVQQVARIKFANKEYKKSMKLLNYVKKQDYIWPHFLIDKAWSFYWLGQYERALGSVMTYRAPLLRRFMVPEATYLRALIYFDMCYFEKTEKEYKGFMASSWKYRKVAEFATSNMLYKLMISKKEPKEKSKHFIYYYLKGYKKDIRFESFKIAMKVISKEIKSFSKLRSIKNAHTFLNLLYFYKKIIRKDFKGFLKNLATDYSLQVKQMRNAFVKLNLMVSLKKRELLSKGLSIKIKDKIVEKSLSDIPNVENKFIWDFRGGFWADELGDYAVALKSRCH